jgi:hypothetical protein
MFLFTPVTAGISNAGLTNATIGTVVPSYFMSCRSVVSGGADVTISLEAIGGGFKRVAAVDRNRGWPQAPQGLIRNLALTAYT